MGLVKLILLLFLPLLLLRLRRVEVVIVIGWRDVVAIPSEVLQRLHVALYHPTAPWNKGSA